MARKHFFLHNCTETYYTTARPRVCTRAPGYPDSSGRYRDVLGLSLDSTVGIHYPVPLLVPGYHW
eukprot:1979605-Rhodomonas_salina.1